MDLVERLDRLCRPGQPDRQLRAAILAAISRQVPFDAHVFALTDPATGVIASPHAAVATVPEARLPDLIRERYARDADAWRRWLRAEFGVSGAVLVTMADRYGRWGFLELWRVASPFSPAERHAIAALGPVLAKALRGTVAETFAEPPAASCSPGDDQAAASGVLLLDGELRVRAESASATAALRRLLPPMADTPPVPAIAFNVAAALLAIERGAWTPPAAGIADAAARVRPGDGGWVTARATRLADGIAVTLAPCTPAERIDLYGRAHGLSPRETEVLDLVVRGLGSREVAASLVIAPTTAEDHLRALLAKTGTTSRAQLIGRALGATVGDLP